ncbi:serine hydrolase [Fulvivirgaceae bacterium BMA10]|uniref:Serine hydrolase n=1 Tax=Splendidivirga corallicola TaxID=3051826 RepID=A0ABT8KIY3_9BACT|nr:serine hydrolase [Fulvivirgaceae bacterium BMA10]
MRRFKHLSPVIFLFLWFVFSSYQTPDTLPKHVIDSIEKRIENGINPSIAIGIIDKKGPKFFNFGKTSKEGQLVEEHTIYEIGSITKVFTAILLAQQVMGGTISLDEPVNSYLPSEVVMPVKGSDKITFGTLSDHTSGLPRMPNNFTPANPGNPYVDYKVEQMYSFISSYEPTRKVGAKYEYSNLAQGLLGHILSLNTDLSYEALMIRNIASPLKMEETKIVFDQNMKNNLAIGHSNGVEVENWDIPTLAGAGAIRSSTSDMLKFLSANLGLTETSLRSAMDMTHQVRHDKAGGMRVGLGWHIKKGANGDVIWHNGGTGGYRAFAGFVKESGKGVVVLTNSTASIDDIGFHLLDPDSELKEVLSKSDAVQVPEEILESYVGSYELAPNFSIAITREGTQLYGQATGQSRFEMFPKNNTEFYLVAVEAQITFQVQKDVVESLTLFQNGQEVVGKKIE